MYLIGENFGHEINAELFESKFQKGETGTIKFYTERDLSDDEVQKIKDNLKSATYEARVLTINFISNGNVLKLIDNVIRTSGLTILGWQLFSEKNSSNILLWGLVGIGLIWLVFSRRKR